MNKAKESDFKEKNNIRKKKGVKPIMRSKTNFMGTIRTGEGTFANIKKRTQERLKKEMEATKKEKVEPKKRENFSRVLFLNLKKGLDNNKTTNAYLFELTKGRFQGQLHDGIYKIDVIKRDGDKIICKIRGENNYHHIFPITNEDIMASKPKADTFEKQETTERKEKSKKDKYIYDMSEEAQEHFKRKQLPKKYMIKAKDFLDEIQYEDSVIIKSKGKELLKVSPDDIIDEIRRYIQEGGDITKSAKKIQNAITFLNESKNQNATEYIKDFFKLVREKQKKRKGKSKAEITKEDFAEVLKRFINKEKLYVHKTNDIDKSSVQFLLKEFGVDAKKRFNEVEHNEVDMVDEGILFDIGGTASGLKTIRKEEKKIENGKEITTTKVKKIASEHSDTSTEAMFTNRPSSTTQIIFKIFKELGAIDKDKLPQIQRFVNFVNTVDSMDYQISSVDYKNNYQTLFGLYRLIPIRDIFEYFKDPAHTGFEKFSQHYLENTKIKNENGKEVTLKEKSEEHKQKIEKNIQTFQELQKEGKELRYNDMNFIVDIEDRLKNGPQTAGFFRYGFLKIYPERGNIYIYSPKKLPEMIEGFPTESEHFLIINHPTQQDLERLIDKFSMDKTQHTQKAGLKEDILAYSKKIQERRAIEPISEEELKMMIGRLPALEKQDIVTKQIYPAIINSIQNKVAFITLDKNKKFNARFKVEHKEMLKQFKVGEKVKVKLSSIEEKEGKMLIEVKSMRKPMINTQ